MRLLIVDDHAVVRRGTMNIIIDRFPDCEFSEAGTLHEARLVLGDTRFDLVVLDISLPDGSGLDFLDFAREHDPGLPVIMLSMHHEIEYAQRCLSMGARGYLSKNSAPEELEEAMTAILDGGIYVNPSLLDSRRPSTVMDTLSRQERDVARRLAQGGNHDRHRPGHGRQRQDRQHLSHQGHAQAGHWHHLRTHSLHARTCPGRHVTVSEKSDKVA